MRDINKTYAFPFLFILFFGVILILSMEHGDMVLWVNHHRNAFFDLIMPYITWIGDGIFFGIIILLALLYQWRTGLIFLVVGLSTLIFSSGLKRLLFDNVPRPKKFFEARGVELDFIDGVEVHSNYSFPSGHTMSVCAMMTIIALTYVKDRKASLLLALSAWFVGFSRIYLLQHFLRDVVAGGAIGFFLAIVIFLAMKRIMKPNEISK